MTNNFGHFIDLEGFIYLFLLMILEVHGYFDHFLSLKYFSHLPVSRIFLVILEIWWYFNHFGDFKEYFWSFGGLREFSIILEVQGISIILKYQVIFE